MSIEAVSDGTNPRRLEPLLYVQVVGWVAFFSLLHPVLYLSFGTRNAGDVLPKLALFLLILSVVTIAAVSSTQEPFRISLRAAQIVVYVFGFVMLVFSAWLIDATGGPAYSFFTWLFGVALILAYCLGKSGDSGCKTIAAGSPNLFSRPVKIVVSTILLLCVVLICSARLSPTDPPAASLSDCIWGVTAIIWSSVIVLLTYYKSLKIFF